MLETKNLTKIYRPKKGVPVTALDGVSLKFPERGMVFLLGKSGSGKSTLLNLLGGLDSYDDGEIIIKGVSSRDFTQTRFDSYRNTYVGFIFQEYNILEEFTVGANIALALELQGKKATDEELNRILEDVDLVGYGNRKPNELSGGQLQRVAIARALVKNPEIIMADEPTGALDSATGKQVFDTLKKLSSDKLVIIVSHDREYAEHYADRIIELSDGKVISDVEYAPDADNVKSISYDGDTVTLPSDYHLSEEDRIAINEYIDRIKSGVKLHFSGLKKQFRPTDESTIPTDDGSNFKLIKSKLPLKSAFRIGGSSLKYKKFRLVITIFLSVVAFTLFALVDTFGAYNHIKTCTNSLVDSNITYASLVKAKKIDRDIDSWWRTYGYMLDDSDIENIYKDSGLRVTGVYVPWDGYLGIDAYIDQTASKNFTETEYFAHAFSFSGFAEIDENDLDDCGFKLVSGKMPDGGKPEIAISSYMAETFVVGGYATGEYITEDSGLMKPIYEKIASPADMIGKTLELNGTLYTVTGIIDTGFDVNRYLPITKSKENESTADTLISFFLNNELEYAKNYSLNCAAMLGHGGLDDLIKASDGIQNLFSSYLSFYYSSDADYISIDPYKASSIAKIDPADVIWKDGEVRTTLGEHELIVTSDCIINYGDSDFPYKDEEDVQKFYNMVFSHDFGGSANYDGVYEDAGDWHVVGIIDKDEHPDAPEQCAYVCDELYGKLSADRTGPYMYAVGAMPDDRASVEKLVSYSYRDDSSVRFQLQNQVTYELDTVNEILVTLSVVFLWIGIGFAVFAAIMLANFITTSISYKRQEIGILRAIGSRSGDVFRIFFSESFIIAMINFFLSSAATLTATIIINSVIRKRINVLITILNFGPRQILLLLVISVGIAAIASFIPVKRIASKRPIDAIRGR